ncbi:Uracil permease [Neobacillus novalis]|uniref:Uracil permease n=1 Tax=Neobacillus novalis TaxID=220687 RepID=A0AA95MNN8_9BACI|nr:Uracil permease [Neobacillus novalis]WHY85494.1 Uracil permease [Neobacillus novalis]
MADQPCPVPSTEQIPLTVEPTTIISQATTSTIKVPVVLAEPTLQIVVESTITLNPAATEIKRVGKNVFLEQVKLVPVSFVRIGTTDFFNVTRAKLFVAGHIRKNIEYATRGCNRKLRDRIADVPFSGFADITTFLTPPIIGVSEESKAAFLNEENGLVPRLDKFFFQNLVKYNEQPFGELVAANFYELDFSPVTAKPEEAFTTLTEKIVLDLTVKVLQTQQLKFTATQQITTPPQGTVGT